jgi:type II secretory pathway pseudopilin PulG
MAIIVVTVLMVAIGPVVAMSVAARVQARRVERASEAAKTYVDGVRSGAIPAITNQANLVGRPFTNTVGSESFLDRQPLLGVEIFNVKIRSTGQIVMIRVITASISIRLLAVTLRVLRTW